MIRRVSLVALLGLSLLATSAAPVLAGKPSKPSPGGTSGSMSLVMVTDTNGDGAPNHGEQLRFNLTTSNPYPVLTVTCTQGGALVYSSSHPYYWPNLWDDPGIFTLSSLAWPAGAAACRAEAKGTEGKRNVVLASMAFSVGA